MCAGRLRRQVQGVLAVAAGAFVFYTAATGPFEGLVQRAVFLALVVCLGYALYPAGGAGDAGGKWKNIFLAADLVLCAAAVAACAYVAWHYEEIMTSLPWATPLDKALTCGLLLAVLELSRRAVGGFVFPLLVAAGLAYALFGASLPGALRHRGFDPDFVTETIFLGDLGIWGMLTGVAATVIAAFVLFGALLLHTGGGQTFMDIAARLGGRQPGGAAKIAAIASGMFGMISGSAVANVATTGNFTIPLMARLGYPRPFAAAVEAVASTGGQIAPPIMGAAAFVMAEILGVPYAAIIAAAVLPALMFYGSVFATVHFVAVRRRLAVVPEGDLPEWRAILAPRRVLPIVAALGGLGAGVWLGRSIATAAFYGIVGLLLAFAATAAGRLSGGEMARRLIAGLRDGGKGMVIIGVLLAGAQVLVSMLNLTGAGVALSSFIVALAGDSAVLVAVIVGGVCLVMGMGLPTTAAYVLVAAVLAPALIAVGVEPLVAHLFVFYFATISVITPPVCVAVFVAAGIAETKWTAAAGEAVRLAAVTYLAPFLLLLHPGMTFSGGAFAVAQAAAAGLAAVCALPALLAGAPLFGRRAVDAPILLAVILLALLPFAAAAFAAPLLFFAARFIGRRFMAAAGKTAAAAAERR